MKGKENVKQRKIGKGGEGGKVGRGKGVKWIGRERDRQKEDKQGRGRLGGKEKVERE